MHFWDFALRQNSDSMWPCPDCHKIWSVSTFPPSRGWFRGLLEETAALSEDLASVKKEKCGTARRGCASAGLAGSSPAQALRDGDGDGIGQGGRQDGREQEETAPRLAAFEVRRPVASPTTSAKICSARPTKSRPSGSTRSALRVALRNGSLFTLLPAICPLHRSVQRGSHEAATSTNIRLSAPAE